MAGPARHETKGETTMRVIALALTVAALLCCAGPVAAQWPPVSPLEPPPTIGITSDGIYLPVVRR